MYYRNTKTGEIQQGKIFRTAEIQMINPTPAKVLEYGWEMIDGEPPAEEPAEDAAGETVDAEDEGV